MKALILIGCLFPISGYTQNEHTDRELIDLLSSTPGTNTAEAQQAQVENETLSIANDKNARGAPFIISKDYRNIGLWVYTDAYTITQQSYRTQELDFVDPEYFIRVFAIAMETANLSADGGAEYLKQFFIVKEQHADWSLEDIMLQAGQQMGPFFRLEYAKEDFGEMLHHIYFSNKTLTDVSNIITDTLKGYDECLTAQDNTPPTKRQSDPGIYCANQVALNID